MFLETDPSSAVSLEGPSYVIWISRINTMLFFMRPPNE